MTGLRRLCVIFLPSPQEHTWRLSLRTAAQAAGWQVVDGEAVDGLAGCLESNAIIQLSNGSRAPLFEPTETLVIADRPAASIAILMIGFDISLIAATRATARLNATCIPAVRGGAQVVSASSRTLTLPGLGQVDRTESAPDVRPIPADPLAFYEKLPPAVGSCATWPADLFEWEGPDAGFTDLTGRRRLLQHGPYLDLCEGAWRADLKFALEMDNGRCELRFEWGSGADCTTYSQLISRAGVYALSLERTWPETAVAELRIWLDRAMFDGTFRILDCTVTYLG